MGSSLPGHRDPSPLPTADDGRTHRAYAYPAELQDAQGPQGEEMHGDAVTDPDGHVWELLYMAPAAG